MGTLVRGNLITDTVEAPGIWMDYANVNSRCTRNVVINAQASSGGIFMEASQKPNMVDRNFVWAAQGNGIYQHDCDELIIAHNFVAKSTGAAVRMQICKGRKVGGRVSTAKRNKIVNNIFVDNGSMLLISDPENVCDYNVFAGSREPFDLASWRKKHGWDEHSVTASIEASFDRTTMELTWRVSSEVPQCPRVDGITCDFWARALSGEKTAPGPFGPLPAEPMRTSVGVGSATGGSD